MIEEYEKKGRKKKENFERIETSIAIELCYTRDKDSWDISNFFLYSAQGGTRNDWQDWNRNYPMCKTLSTVDFTN